MDFLRENSLEFMSCTDSASIPDDLDRARQGDKEAEERIAKWLMNEVQRKVLFALRQKKTSPSESSIIGEVLIKLVRSKLIHRATGVAYLRAAIAKATREILIDLWRKRSIRRQNGEYLPSGNEMLFRKFDETEWDVIALHRALDRLAELDSKKAMVVTLRYFCGMKVEEVAVELGVSKSNVEYHWGLARAWLYRHLTKD